MLELRDYACLKKGSPPRGHAYRRDLGPTSLSQTVTMPVRLPRPPLPVSGRYIRIWEYSLLSFQEVLLCGLNRYAVGLSEVRRMFQLWSNVFLL